MPDPTGREVRLGTDYAKASEFVAAEQERLREIARAREVYSSPTRAEWEQAVANGNAAKAELDGKIEQLDRQLRMNRDAGNQHAFLLSSLRQDMRELKATLNATLEAQAETYADLYSKLDKHEAAISQMPAPKIAVPVEQIAKRAEGRAILLADLRKIMGTFSSVGWEHKTLGDAIRAITNG